MKKKYSITRNIAYTMIGMVTGTVLLCWFLNSTFLESFYTVNKENALLEGFHTIDKAVINDTFESDEFDIAFERICSNGNISILVLSPDAQVLRSSAGNSEKLKISSMGHYMKVPISMHPRSSRQRITTSSKNSRTAG